MAQKRGRKAFERMMQSFWKKCKRLLRFPLGPVVVASATIIFFWPAVSGKAADPKPQEVGKPPGPPPSLAIPVADISTRAMEASNLIRSLTTMFYPSPEVEKIQKELPGISRDIDLQFGETLKILQRGPALATIQRQQQLWQEKRNHAAGWLKTLRERAAQLQNGLNRLADLQKIWTMTKDAARAAKAPGSTLRQIETTLAAVAAAQPPLQAKRALLFDLQGRIAKEVGRCEIALEKIAQTQQKAVSGIFKRDLPPLWKSDLWSQVPKALPVILRETSGSYWAEIRQYVYDPSRGMPLHVGFFVALVVILSLVRRQVIRWTESGEGTISAANVFDLPRDAALLGVLLVASGPLSSAPANVKALFHALAFVPMIRLSRSAVPSSIVPGLYGLGILFGADIVRRAFAASQLDLMKSAEVGLLIGQTILTLEGLCGGVLLGWLLYSGYHQRASVSGKELGRKKLAEAFAIFILSNLTAGLLAGAFGYLRLASLLIPGILVGGALALTIVALFRVVAGMVAFFLRIWPLRLLRAVQKHRDLLERRAWRLLLWLGVLTWGARYLDYVGLLEPAFSYGRAVLTTKLERGVISISVGDILAFFLAIWASYLLSAFIRFVLREDVYPRTGTPQGVSYATSILLHYILIALGFIVGIGMLGVDLTKVTVLAGAFGIGIGFGLQGVVNNFVSGLILLFERPVYVGDTIEMDDMLCEIRRIGMRASIVRTWKGADIIVPNSQLTSEKLTNWTLGDRLRRIDLPVGISYSAAPQEVIKVLEKVAQAHPEVMKDPAPEAHFVGYGDSSINFELWAWTDKFYEWPRIRSNLAVSLYDAVHAAGMSFPFPQREVRLLSDSDASGRSIGRRAGVGSDEFRNG
jgi:potassium efflux system protein